MKSHILVDFTQDKQAIFGALNTLRIPGFSETNLWDAMYDTLDRLDRIPGHKELVIVASGRDTMSHMTFDKILKKVKSTPNVTIYTITTGAAMRLMAEARYGNNPDFNAANMDYLVADNQMKTFAQLTGGRWYSPRFMGELPEDFKEIAQSIRNQYTITYQSTQSQAGRHLPQAESGTRWARRQAARDQRREEQGHQVPDHRARRLHRQARGRVAVARFQVGSHCRSSQPARLSRTAFLLKPNGSERQPVSFSPRLAGRRTRSPATDRSALCYGARTTLYVRFRCRYRAIDVFPDAESNGRRDELWDRDVAEVFLQPDRFGEKYYKEFEVSPNGQWLDLDITPEGLRTHHQRDAKLGQARRIQHAQWTAELAIPMAAITAQLRSCAILAGELLSLRRNRSERFYSALAADRHAGAELPRAAEVRLVALRQVISACCTMPRLLPSGSRNQATFVPSGAVQIPSSSCSKKP